MHDHYGGEVHIPRTISLANHRFVRNHYRHQLSFGRAEVADTVQRDLSEACERFVSGYQLTRESGHTDQERFDQ